MRTVTRKKKISLIICICMIVLAILTMASFVMHRDHKCDEHQTTHGCEICIQFDSVMNKLMKVSLLLVIVAIGNLVMQEGFSITVYNELLKLKQTPVTLKVKMNN